MIKKDSSLKPADTGQTTESKSESSKPTESKPTEAKPVNAKPASAKSESSKSALQKPSLSVQGQKVQPQSAAAGAKKLANNVDITIKNFREHPVVESLYKKIYDYQLVEEAYKTAIHQYIHLKK